MTQTDTPGPALPLDVYGPSGAGIIGDPHTLFSARAPFRSGASRAKKLPVDWQVYAHSGRQSFTKGRRLTCFSTCQEDLCGKCLRSLHRTWKARKGNEEWTVMDSGGPGTQCRAPCQMLRSTSQASTQDCDRSSWSSLSQPCALQHEGWQIRHCGHEPQLQAKPQHQCLNIHETQE